MGAKQEDIRNLENIKQTLEKQAALLQKIKEEERAATSQRKKILSTYPAYVPSTFKTDVQKEWDKKKEQKATQFLNRCFCVKLGILTLFSLLSLFFGGEAPLEALKILNAVVAICIPLLSTAVWFLTSKIMGLQAGGDVNDEIVRQAWVGVGDLVPIFFFFVIGCAQEYAPCIVFSILDILMCIILLPVLYSGCKRIFNIASTQEREEIAEAIRKDEEHRAEYDRQKAAVERGEATPRNTTSNEATSKMLSSEINVEMYRQKLYELQNALDAMPGLAKRDKNLYTVSTLLEYLQSGKADTIEQAIDLLDGAKH